MQFAGCALQIFCRQLISTWLGGGHLIIGGALIGVAANVDFDDWRPENRNFISSGFLIFFFGLLCIFLKCI